MRVLGWWVLSGAVASIRAEARYSPMVAKRLLLHSDAAYCGDDTGGHGSTAPLLQWRCRPCTDPVFSNETVTLIGVAQHGGRDAFAYVALQGGDVVVSFRGSVLPKNYEDDEDAIPAAWAPAPGALVHQGFVRSYSSIREQIIKLLTLAHKRMNQKAGVTYITGHSLGAAQATLAVVDLAQQFPNHTFVEYNFGDLRVGDAAFVKRYVGMHNIAASWRVVHRYDPVPQIIPRLLYKHVPREVWYTDPADNGSMAYVICDGKGEDPHCQDSVPRNNLVGHDHDFYLNHAMWCCAGAVNSSSACSFPFPNGPKFQRKSMGLVDSYQNIDAVATIGAERSVPIAGLGTELCWQSLNDTGLAKAAAATHSTVARFPGGTPSDYWDWSSGWATDVKSMPVRPATPQTWARYAAAAELNHTVLVVNQLTSNLSHQLRGLTAHQENGTPVAFVELGNEMYDDTRADVLAAYPNGSVYGRKMANWSAAIKAKFPAAKVALLAMSWREDLDPHLASWNDGAFQPEYLGSATAATIHPYFGIRWSVDRQDASDDKCGRAGLGATGQWLKTSKGCSKPCCCRQRCIEYGGCRAWQFMTDGKDAGACYLKGSPTLAENSASTAGTVGPPPPPSMSSVHAVFSSAFKAFSGNQLMMAKLPTLIRELWVTEMAAYGAAGLNFTWLETLTNLLFEMLLLRMHKVTMIQPYCLVCGDPIAPNLAAPTESDPHRAAVPPADAGKVKWNQTIRSLSHAMLFESLKVSFGGSMAPLQFSANPPLLSEEPATETYVGWAMTAVSSLSSGEDASITGVFVNLGNRSASLNLSVALRASIITVRCLFTKSIHDLTSPLLTPATIGQLEATSNDGVVKAPPFSLCAASPRA